MTKLDISENQASIVYLSIGSNLGNRRLNIEKTKFFLNQYKINITHASKFYETLSWPDQSKPKFLNIVLKILTNYSPIQLLRICQSIEIKVGRKKDIKNAPRICDIDIIDYNGIVKNKGLQLPHKLMHTRNFVLFPLYEINKSWVHPILKIDVKTLIFSLPDKDISSIKQI